MNIHTGTAVEAGREGDGEGGERERSDERVDAYALRLLAVVAVLVDELRDLLLQAVVLLHEQLVHGRQLPVQRLQPGRLLPLLLPAPACVRA